MAECMSLKKPQRAKRKLGQEKELAVGLAQAELAEVAEKVRYVGSPYHRPTGSPMGQPKDRNFPEASRCDRKWTRPLANRALKASIIQGLVSSDWDNGFPRKVWYRDGETLYKALLSNRDQGEYHAYPLNERREWPAELR